MDRKTIFENVKAARGGLAFTAGEVATLDAVLDTLRVPRDGTATQRRIGSKGLAIIKEFEGCATKLADGRIKAYRDPGTGHLPITIGWGTTKGFDGKPIPEGTVMTQQQVDDLFARDLQKYADEVADAIDDAPTTQEQFDALVSFHYNTGAIRKATLTKLHSQGDYAAAAGEFAKWNKSGGKVLKGLSRRRAAEADLYRSTTP